MDLALPPEAPAILSQTYLSLIREKLWIVKARVTMRNVISNCFDCKRRQSPIGVQKMADLSADRVTPEKPPFSFVGVDCFGPFLVKVKSRGTVFCIPV